MSDKALAKIHFVTTTYIAPVVGAVVGTMFGPLLGFLASMSIRLKSSLMMELFYDPNPSAADSPNVAPVQPLAGKDVLQPINYGTPIQQIWGRARVTCTIINIANEKLVRDAILIWSDVEGRVRVSKKRKVGGFYQLALVETPVVTFAAMIGGPITAVHRIWFNGSLVYDRTLFGDARVQYRTTSADFKIYFGTDDQMPDPDLGTDVAYRGRSYIVFKNVSLLELNGRLPEVVVEVSGADIGFQYTDSKDYYNEYFDYTKAEKIIKRIDTSTGETEIKTEYTIDYDSSGNINVLDSSGNPVGTSVEDEDPWNVLPLPGKDVTDPNGVTYVVQKATWVGIAYPKAIWRLFDRSDGASPDRYWLPGPDEVPGRFFGSGFDMHKKFPWEAGRNQFFGNLFAETDSWFYKDQLTHGDSIKVVESISTFKLGNEQYIHFKKDNTRPYNPLYPFYPDKQPINLWALDEKIPLSFPLTWILKKIGFTDDEIDVTETATIKVHAVVLRSAHTAETLLAHLCNAYGLTVCESEGKIKIRPENQPVWNRDYRNCLISETGLTVNSLHDVLGRAGYFPSSCGTSEGQFTMGRAAAEAYKTTNHPDWLEFATRIADATLRYFYLAPPSNSNVLFVPHWLFVTKRPVKLDSSILYANLPSSNGEIQIPTGSPFHGEKTKKVTKIGNGWGAYMWKNPEADHVYIGYAPAVIVTAYQGNGRAWYWPREFDKWVCDEWAYDEDGNPIACLKSHNEYKWADKPDLANEWAFSGSGTFHTYIDMGSFSTPAKPLYKPNITHYATDYEIIDVDQNTGLVRFQQRAGVPYPEDRGRKFVTYIRSEIGEYLPTESWIEAWPHWRKMKRGELAGAGDSLFWGYDMYEILHEITNDHKYFEAAEASKNTTISVHDLDDGRLWWFKFPGVSDFFVDDSIFIRIDRSSMSTARLGRDAVTGSVIIDVPKGAGEVQIGRGIHDTSTTNSDSLSLEIEVIYKNEDLEPFEYDPLEGLKRTGVVVWFDTSQTYKPQNRFLYSLHNELNSGLTKFTVPISGFETLMDPANPHAKYSGGDIYAFGISIYQETLEIKMQVGDIRPAANTPLEYVPGAPIFTVNTYLGNKIPWSGVPGIGYAYPHFWKKINRSTELNNITQFLKDAAAEYQSRTGETGWMVPAFYWKRFDNLEYGTPGTWGWNWVDPNAQWAGYFCRNLASMAEAGTPDLVQLAVQRLIRINIDWPGWPNFIITDVKGETLPHWQPYTEYNWRGYNGNSDIIRPSTPNGYVYKPIQNGISGGVEPVWPTSVGGTVSDGSIIWECTGYQYGYGAYGNYHEPHFAGLILRAAFFIDNAGLVNGSDQTHVRSAAEKCFNYLKALYRRDPADPMYGSFADANDNWWGFWHGEIIITISLILRSSWNPGAWLDRAELTEWLNGSLEFWKRWDRKRYDN